MCGIVGYIGNKVVDKQLLESLKLLEYRGYDSSGVAVLKNNQINVIKAEGKIACLEQVLTNEAGASLGIAHTRWATHGKPNTNNAHPHLSQNKQWAVVHNGIIENFADLKRSLIQKYKFESETDTEVIAHLLEEEKNENNIQKLIYVCEKLKGSFALAVINNSVSDTLYLAKRKSPLYVAQSNGEVFVASDPICFVGKSNTYFSLNEDEFCEAKINNLVFYNKNGEKIKKQPSILTEMEQNFGKQNYEHFMLKEIEEVPTVLKRIVKVYSENNPFEKLDKNLLNNINKIIFIGCGTAYHASLMGASFVESIAKIEARGYVASEFRYMDPIIDSKTLAIFVSQSGETADTLMAHEKAKQKGAKTIALTNVLYSSLAKETDYVLPVCAGPEIAVASTKAYTAQITILNMFAKYLNNCLKNINLNYLAEIENLIVKVHINNRNLNNIANELVIEKSCFFIGKGLDAITSEEASLKLKEITYINSQSYPAGELKHGFLALVENGTFVFVVATQRQLIEKTLNASHEALARGAKIVLATQEKLPESTTKDLFSVIALPECADDLMPIITIGYFQLLSYLTSVKKGIDPDKPRNLAKSVTVE